MALPSQAILIIGHHFPEPSTTAAGTRMMQLISLFQDTNSHITFASIAKTSQHSVNLEQLGITVENIQLNDASFDTFISALQPNIVLFDRYITQEQFGWRVTKHCPDALTILDTEDLHFLRKAREEAFKKTGDASQATLFTELAKRELASMLRCDVTLIISAFEMKLLQENFSIPSSVLQYLPFLLEPLETTTIPSFKARTGFMTIGNLRHAPNVDAVKYLKKEIWPAIKEQLPEARLSIFGMYAPQHIQQMHNEKEGFLIKGWASSAQKAFREAKVCLAPLRFGAGLKGKVVEAFQYGTPVITTAIGAEGIFTATEIPSSLAHNTQSFIDKAIASYTDASLWQKQQQKGFDSIASTFQKERCIEAFVKRLNSIQNDLHTHRQQHFIGLILQHQSLQASKYMSKWIEEKNKA